LGKKKSKKKHLKKKQKQKKKRTAATVKNLRVLEFLLIFVVMKYGKKNIYIYIKIKQIEMFSNIHALTLHKNLRFKMYNLIFFLVLIKCI
jgi:hypothetical protein